MHRLLFLLAFSLIGWLLPTMASATSVTPMTPSQRASESGAIFRATTESLRPFRDNDGFIHTRATFAVSEVFKGRVPSRITLTYWGGVLNGEAQTVSLMPELAVGQERLLFLALHPDGRLTPVGGPGGVQLIEADNLNEIRRRFPEPVPGADLTGFEATETGAFSLRSFGSLEAASSGAIPANALQSPPRRFTITDRGEPIRYVIDYKALPPGISFAEAMNAVDNALAAWSEVSSLTFERLGYADFKKSANMVNFGNETLAIQLHNLYGAIADSSTLGLGGQASTTGIFPDGGAGGRIEAIEFNRTQRGYVILNHTAAAMANLDTFEEVLCHEIGHALGLAHSSENPDETNPLRTEAIMYYAANGKGRGAELAIWDIDAINLAYPADSQPPYSFDHLLRAVSSTKPLTHPEVNQIKLHGFSPQGAPLTLELLYPTETYGSFSLSGTTVTYTPNELVEGPEASLATGSYDRVFVRFSDGVNLSPPVQVRVVRIFADQHPLAAPDGLPDSWAEAHFGSMSPTAGLSRAQDDPDEDGFSNLQEFLFGTDPRAFGRFSITSITPDAITFPARPYGLYELETSPDLIAWESAKGLQPTSETGEIAIPDSDEARQFFRVKRVH